MLVNWNKFEYPVDVGIAIGFSHMMFWRTGSCLDIQWTNRSCAVLSLLPSFITRKNLANTGQRYLFTFCGWAIPGCEKYLV